MAKNQFVVDLGPVNLSDAQRKSINAAIQGAVTQELAKLTLKKKIVLIPVDKWPKGPILEGLIARDFGKEFEALINTH
jgi:hypothetical protein